METAVAGDEAEVGGLAAVFGQAGDDAVDDVAVLVVVLFGVGVDAGGDGAEDVRFLSPPHFRFGCERAGLVVRIAEASRDAQ